MKFDYDVLVIGGGAAGLTAAKTANGLGKKVAIIEKADRLGGECTWTGCIPSKTLIKSAQVAWHAKNMSKYGLEQNKSEFNASGIMKYVRDIVQEDYQSHTPQVIKNLGIDVLFGGAKFVDTHELEFEDKKITFNKAIIATGSRPLIPPVSGLVNSSYLTNENLFSLDQLPQSIIIMGGGAIGCEMASALNRLGVVVTLVEMGPTILPREDAELVAKLTDIMRSEGVKILTQSKINAVHEKKGAVRAQVVDSSGKESELQVEKLLVAVGRLPNIENLNLSGLDIKFSKRAVQTNSYMQTSCSNIFAAGDVVGPYQFSHMAWYQGMIAARNASMPFFQKKISYQTVAWVTFTAPELAHLGLTEREAQEKFPNQIEVISKPYTQIDRAVTDRATQGIAKYILDKKGRLLGAQILGARAGEIMDELLFIKQHNIPFYKLGSVVHAYPTYCEINWHASRKAYINRLERSIFVRLYKWLFFSSKN